MTRICHSDPSPSTFLSGDVHPRHLIREMPIRDALRTHMRHDSIRLPLETPILDPMSNDTQTWLRFPTPTTRNDHETCPLFLANPNGTAPRGYTRTLANARGRSGGRLICLLLLGYFFWPWVRDIILRLVNIRLFPHICFFCLIS